MAEAKKTSSKKTVATKAAKTDKASAIKVKKVEKAVTPGVQSEDTTAETSQTAAVVEKVPATATAKAGKRSEKALKEAKEKATKEERKAQAKTEEDTEKSKVTQKPPRSRLERRAKGYRKAAEQLEKGKAYSLKEALELATRTSHVKFDATVELHVRLNVDPKQADQNIRDTVVLPAGTGKSVRVAVFAAPDQLAAAQSAGADIALGDEFLQQLDKGTIDFDILIATPQMMAKLGKYARLLGPKGLMPNPKSGTVTADVTKGVKEAKAGRVEYRVDSTGIIHVGMGKVSFGATKLLENAQALLGSIKGNKPASVKAAYIKTIFVTTSMGPSISVAAEA